MTKCNRNIETIIHDAHEACDLMFNEASALQKRPKIAADGNIRSVWVLGCHNIRTMILEHDYHGQWKSQQRYS